LFSDHEKELFSHVVEMAEKQGKPVELLTVPALNPFDAMAHAANTLRASRLVNRRKRPHGIGRTGTAHQLHAAFEDLTAAVRDLRNPNGGGDASAKAAAKRSELARALCETIWAELRRHQTEHKCWR